MKHLRLASALALAGACIAGPVSADARLTILLDLLRVDAVVEVLQEEGHEYASILNEDMLGGQGGAFFQAQVQRIYDPLAMTEYIRGGFSETMDDGDLDAAIAFFGTELGAKVVSYEIAARRAMMDDDVEEAARAEYKQAREAGDPRLSVIDRFERENDLIDRNVAAALSSNLAFYNGLADGDFVDMSEDQRLAQVYAQEESMREDTEDWLFSFFLMAYQALEPQELDAYVAFSTSAAGAAFNRALFAGHEQMYRDISYALGRVVALSSTGSAL